MSDHVDIPLAVGGMRNVFPANSKKIEASFTCKISNLSHALKSIESYFEVFHSRCSFVQVFATLLTEWWITGLRARRSSCEESNPQYFGFPDPGGSFIHAIHT